MAAAPCPGCLRLCPAGCLGDRDSGSCHPLAWHQSCCWAGEPQSCLCTEAAVPGKLGSQVASVAQPHTVLGGSCSCGAEQPQGSGILPAPAATQQVSAEGLNVEPDGRQDWLCQLEDRHRGESFTCVSARGCTPVMDRESKQLCLILFKKFPLFFFFLFFFSLY